MAKTDRCDAAELEMSLRGAPHPPRSRSAPSRQRGEGRGEGDGRESADGIWHNLRVSPDTLADPSLASANAIAVRNGAIAWLGEERAIPHAFAAMPRHDGHGALVTAGLVDCQRMVLRGIVTKLITNCAPRSG